MTPSGIEPVTFRFVAQYLNHCATAVRLWHSCGNPKFRIFCCCKSVKCQWHCQNPLTGTKTSRRLKIAFPSPTRAAELKQWKQQKYLEFLDGFICCPRRPFNLRIPTRFKNFAVPTLRNILIVKLSEVTVKFLGTKVPCTLGRPCTEDTWLYCDYFIWFVSCTVVVLTCFEMCVCVYVWVL